MGGYPCKKTAHFTQAHPFAGGALFLRANQQVLRPFIATHQDVDRLALVGLGQGGFKVLHAGHFGVGNGQHHIARGAYPARAAGPLASATCTPPRTPKAFFALPSGRSTRRPKVLALAVAPLASGAWAIWLSSAGTSATVMDRSLLFAPAENGQAGLAARLGVAHQARQVGDFVDGLVPLNCTIDIARL